MTEFDRLTSRSFDPNDLRHPTGPYSRTRPIPLRFRKLGGVTLCLSGGGFRAAAYHLGALRRLHELGLLHYIDEIRSVSGGSILAAWLADRIVKRGGVDLLDWEADVATPFRLFLERDLRTLPFLATVAVNWFWKTPRLAMLESSLQRHLTSLSLASLPERPRFSFLATDILSGGLVSMPNDVLSSDWSVARAVVASASFPPIFGPMAARSVGGEDQALLDGGVWGNLGVSGRVLETGSVVMVSDASYPLTSEASLAIIPQMWLRRALAVALHRGDSALRHQMWLNDTAKQRFEVWRISDTSFDPAEDTHEEYPHDIVKRIASLPTDLAGFSVDQISILENHGYLRCAAAVSMLLERTRESQKKSLREVKFGNREVAGLAKLASQTFYPLVDVPHARFCDFSSVRKSLRISSGSEGK